MSEIAGNVAKGEPAAGVSMPKSAGVYGVTEDKNKGGNLPEPGLIHPTIPIKIIIEYSKILKYIEQICFIILFLKSIT
ncbi:hypothetical protein LEP1GSC082_1610 [Leptospira kirschneri str. H2]|nr:hypothetical protein LEP1GSC082_1610 [Leptospira kirschneri str. H2]